MPTRRTLLSPGRPWYRQRWPIILAGFAAAYLSGVLIAVVVRSQGAWDQGMPWERELLTAVHPPLPYLVDLRMMVVPWFGTNISLMPVIGLIVIWLWVGKKRANLAMWLLVVQLGSYALNPSLKATFDRVRPEMFPKRGWFGWSSFPSGHAIAGISVLMTLALMLHRERGWKWPFFVAGGIALANMYSRIYLAVHWPTDVLAGAVVGLVWLWACYMSFREAPQAPTAETQSRRAA